ncbi:MAG: S-adenosylmethionine decarboxylase [Acidobacteriota bacterium]|nr:S-adenosylmethionine decarboxylase [Acidobacteriota bacterium]MDH3528004.1 S-adenosylmethionine decarboxylase [Acidobacteriota bacterium]
MIVGREWLIEADGCTPEILRDRAVLKTIFSAVISDLGLKTIGDGIWHCFPGEGGVTGLVALTESHLACHTYPEYGLATFNLYCCRERPEWDWKKELSAALGATSVSVTKITRGTNTGTGAIDGGNTGDIDIELDFSAAGGSA